MIGSPPRVAVLSLTGLRRSAQGFSLWCPSCKVKVAPNRGAIKSSVISPRHRGPGRVLEIPGALACLCLVVVSIYLNAFSDRELTTSLANHSLAREQGSRTPSVPNLTPATCKTSARPGEEDVQRVPILRPAPFLESQEILIQGTKEADGGVTRVMEPGQAPTPLPGVSHPGHPGWGWPEQCTPR